MENMSFNFCKCTPGCGRAFVDGQAHMQSQESALRY